MALRKRLRKAVRLFCAPSTSRARLHDALSSAQKREVTVGEKPATIKTHLRNMIVVPEMIGSVVGVYNGKTFNAVEIKVCIVLSPDGLVARG